MIVRFLASVLVLASSPLLRADNNPAVPSPGFPAAHYSSLWIASPFSIATPDITAAPADYQLVGLAQFNGVSYASLVDRRTQEHFVLTSDQPARNLKLVSVTHGPGGTSVVVNRNGELLSLKQDVSDAAVLAATAAAAPAPETPDDAPPIDNLHPLRPPIRVHHHLVIIPPPPPPPAN